MSKVEKIDVLEINRQAMDYLQKGKVLASEQYLLRAQEMLKIAGKGDYKQWAITLNNLACVYKSKGNCEKALKNLFLALDTEMKYIKNTANIASIYLNIAFIYSEMKMFKKSLSHSLEALKCLNESEEKDSIFWVTLCSSYLLAGKQYENLIKNDLALKMYSNGYECAEKNLGKFDILTIKLKKALKRLDDIFKSLQTFIPRSITPTRFTPRKLSPLRDKETEEVNLNTLKTFDNKRNIGFQSVKRHRLKVTLNKSNISSLSIVKNRLSPISIFSEEKIKKESSLKTTEKKANIKNEEIAAKKQFDDVKEKTATPKEMQKNLIEKREVSVYCNFLQKVRVKDEEIQTKFESKNSECQTNALPDDFRKIAVLVIQRFWRSYQAKKPKKYTEISPVSYTRQQLIRNSGVEAETQTVSDQIQGVDKNENIKLELNEINPDIKPIEKPDSKREINKDSKMTQKIPKPPELSPSPTKPIHLKTRVLAKQQVKPVDISCQNPKREDFLFTLNSKKTLNSDLTEDLFGQVPVPKRYKQTF